MAKRIKRKTRSAAESVEPDFPPLSAREIAEIRRRVAEVRDPTRYVIVSPFSRRFCLYYCPEDGNYIMNEIPVAALFKRKAEAMAIVKVLERGRVERGRAKRMRRSLQVIAVKKTKAGVRFLEEVADPWEKGKRWKPVVRRREKSDS